MKFDQFLPYFVVATPVLLLLSLTICAIFLSRLKKQIQEIGERSASSAEAINSVLIAVAGLEKFNPQLVEARLAEVENRKPAVVTDAASPAFIGTSRRGQVLRLSRSGETPAHIAETLGVSQGEVKLTLKLRDLFASAKQ